MEKALPQSFPYWNPWNVTPRARGMYVNQSGEVAGGIQIGLASPKNKNFVSGWLYGRDGALAALATTFFPLIYFPRATRVPSEVVSYCQSSAVVWTWQYGSKATEELKAASSRVCLPRPLRVAVTWFMGLPEDRKILRGGYTTRHDLQTQELHFRLWSRHVQWEQYGMCTVR